MRRAATDIPALGDDLARGEYKPLLHWLQDKIHRQGSRHRPRELIRLATGEPTGVRDHVEYLKTKFVGAAA
jgi:carboxypeptidase Taq